MKKIFPILVSFICIFSGCGKKQAEVEVTNNSGSELNNIELILDSGRSHTIERLENTESTIVVIDRNDVGAFEIFVDGIRCFSVNTEGALGKVRIDAVPIKPETTEIELQQF